LLVAITGAVAVQKHQPMGWMRVGERSTKHAAINIPLVAISEAMHVTFLGTGGSWPSPQRNVVAIAVRLGPEVALLDCGEGTQRQLMMSNVSFMKISRVFITHFHGDHFLGLPGLIQSMALNDRKEPLEVLGPEGIVELMKSLLQLGYFKPTFEVRVRELKAGESVDFGRYSATCALAEHSVPCLAYALEEAARPGRFNKARALELGVPEGPMFSRLQSGEAVELPDGRKVEPSMVLGPPRRGRKLVYSGDTKPCESVERLAAGSDILVHDATAAADNEDKANMYGHSSARQAAELAKRAGARMLALVHVSPRYEEAKPLLDEAMPIHPKTTAPGDLDEFDVPFPED
jgi:ribonuclease Z